MLIILYDILENYPSVNVLYNERKAGRTPHSVRINLHQKIFPERLGTSYD